MTCPADLRRAGFFPAHTEQAQGHIIHLGIADTKVFVTGELVKDDTNGALTNGAASITTDLWAGIANESAGSATASANASTKLAVYVPALWTEFFWAYANGTPSATHCFVIWDFGAKNSVDVSTTASAGEVGFKPYGYDATNTMLYGVFAVMG
jgi:hypothetical protein